VLQADRPEFDRQSSLICAAYNVPLKDFAETWWAGGFHKLRLDDWIRLVTHVIGPKGPDKMPTAKQLWNLRTQLAKEARAPGVRGTDDVLTAIVETAIARWPLTDAQRRMAWNWIARDQAGSDCAILGVIIPQDPIEPTKYPAHRLMVAELEQRIA